MIKFENGTNKIQLQKTTTREGLEETVLINVPVYEGFKVEDLVIMGQILHAKSTELNVKLPKMTDLHYMKEAKVETKVGYAKDVNKIEKAYKDTYKKVEHLDTKCKPNEKVFKLLYVECPHCSENSITKQEVNTQTETNLQCPSCKKDITVSPLVKMAKMKYSCECGGSGFMHFAMTTTTDLPLREDDTITVDCVKCKQPIDLMYNSKKNTFEQK